MIAKSMWYDVRGTAESRRYAGLMKASQRAFYAALIGIALITIGLPAATAKGQLLAAKSRTVAHSAPATAGGAVYPQFKCANGLTSRWIHEQMPFKVWMARGLSLDKIIDPASGAPVMNTANTAHWPDAVINVMANQEQLNTLPIAELYSDQQYQAALQGITSWKALEKEGLYSFEITDNPEDADVYVFWTNHFVNKMGLALFENDIRGLTARYLLPVRDVVAAIQRNDLETVRRSRKPVVILLRTAESDGTPINLGKMKAAAAHEFGHALGIDGHSPFPGDLMSIYYGRGVISPNDAATMRYVYRHPADLMP